MDPTSLLQQSLVWIQCLIATCCTVMESCKGEKFRIWQKSSHNFDNTSMMSDIFLVCMLVVKGCQTLVMDPTSLLQQSLVWIQCLIATCCTVIESCKGEKFRIWQKSSHNFDNTSLMSDIFLVCMLVVKGCQTLVMDPTSLLQQSLVNTVRHYLHHAALILSLVRVRNSGFLDKNLATTLTTHHWCLTSSWCVCWLWRVVRPW